MKHNETQKVHLSLAYILRFWEIYNFSYKHIYFCILLSYLYNLYLIANLKGKYVLILYKNSKTYWDTNIIYVLQLLHIDALFLLDELILYVAIRQLIIQETIFSQSLYI